MRLIKIENVSNVPLFLIKSKKYLKSIVAYDDIYIQKSDLMMAKRILKKNNIEYSIRRGRLLHFGYYFSVVLSLLAIMMVGLIFAKNNMSNITVECEDSILAAQIKKYVQDEFTLTQRKNDLKLIKESVIQKYDDVAFCEVKNDQNKLKIIITLVKFNEPLEKGENITAVEDGIITRIVAKSGTVNVKVGDIVKKGEVLIVGKYLNYVEEEISVVPEGVIYAKIYKKQSLVVPKQQMQKVYTGNKKAKYAINFLSDTDRSSYVPKYDNYSTRKYYVWPFNCKLCSIIKYEYSEYKYEKTEVDNEKLNEIILNEQVEYMSNLSINGEPINIRAIKKEVDNFYFIDIYYEIEQCISMTNN